MAALQAALNNAQGGGAGTFRLAITSATGAAGAEWYGQGSNAPSITVNYTPGSGATLAPAISSTPAVGSVAVTGSVVIGNNTTLTASNVTDTGGNVTSVGFYLQANTNNGNAALGDIFLGNGSITSGNATNGTWTLGNVSTLINLNGSILSPGNYTFYAVAKDDQQDVSPLTQSAPVNLQAAPTPGWLTLSSGASAVFSTKP